MEILSTTGNSTIKVIPRKEVSNAFVLYKNVSTNRDRSVFDLDLTYLENHVSFVLEEDTKTVLKVKEGQFVHFELYEGTTLAETNNLLYRGRIFFTDQTINQNAGDTYSVNKDVYEEAQVGNNDYIIY
jgi:phytoene dehydrogenase-like protein